VCVARENRFGYSQNGKIITRLDDANEINDIDDGDVAHGAMKVCG